MMMGIRSIGRGMRLGGLKGAKPVLHDMVAN
jgi:hypothetical protein